MWQSPNVYKGLELSYRLKLSCLYSSCMGNYYLPAAAAANFSKLEACPCYSRGASGTASVCSDVTSSDFWQHSCRWSSVPASPITSQPLSCLAWPHNILKHASLAMSLKCSGTIAMQEEPKFRHMQSTE